MDSPIEWPVKQRELIKWVTDSRVWNDFVMRDDDIVICTWSKSGTTWTQQIVGQLIFGGRPGLYHGAEASPWIDFRLRPEARAIADAQTHRRFLKTHLPLDALSYSPKAKYIYIGRDGRDVFWSWHKHWSSFKPEALAHINSFYPDQPTIPYPDPDIRRAFLDWLDSDAYPNWPFWSHVQGWFDARRLPNLHLLHFANLKADFENEVRRLAGFLDIAIAPETWPKIVEQCSFDYVRGLAAPDPTQAVFLVGGGATFINKGTNGRWRDVLTEADVARYLAEAARHLTPDCARWLATGELPA
ncbi:MAG: sulfotransferase domain-containing protein [Hyphomicrobiales bacterium]|nr:MAG: sulfotransferase domain-containing protein [Hyphomicrobiales bacterium]